MKLSKYGRVQKYFKKFNNRKFTKIRLKKDIIKTLMFSEHHLSHAASAFYPSAFNNSVILTMDGVGEYTTSSLGVGKTKFLLIKKSIFLTL